MLAVDCAASLTMANAQALKVSGVTAAGRYLTGRYALTPGEIAAIHGAGLSLFLIYETSPTQPSYFTYAQGLQDAKQAIAAAVSLRAPNGVGIYFTVDYDAQPGDMSAIIDYVHGARDGLGGKYLLGLYGSYAVVTALRPYVDKVWQTYAWSGAQTAPNDIYQYENNARMCGVSVDLDYINPDAGLWEGENNVQLDNLVLCYGDADWTIAGDLAQSLKCPVAWASNATPELLACATTKYQVGGSSAPAGVKLLGGEDRLDTMLSVLKAMGRV